MENSGENTTGGQVHVYTGDGKGKTTAALGLAMRAAGAGKRILFVQFVKGREYSEISMLRAHMDAITFRNFGRECFIGRVPETEDYKAASVGFTELKRMISGPAVFDLIIADELTIALHYGLLSMADVRELITLRPPQSELVITGRYASAELIEMADLVTEMKEIRHYFGTKNLLAREGIEY